MNASDRLTRPRPAEPDQRRTEDGGPSTPDVDRPTAPDDLMRRLKNVDPKQAEKYRQRSGE
jgi:hypothetical protein